MSGAQRERSSTDQLVRIHPVAPCCGQQYFDNKRATHFPRSRGHRCQQYSVSLPNSVHRKTHRNGYAPVGSQEKAQ